MQTVLSDHNCEGQAEAIFQALQHQGFFAVPAYAIIALYPCRAPY